MWTVLSRVFPKADIPVVQMSVNPDAKPEEWFKIGQTLAPLRKKDVLIIGSGALVHNLNLMVDNKVDPKKLYGRAVEFEKWIMENIYNNDAENLLKFYEKAPNAKQAVPTSEHFIPLIYALGAGSTTKKPNILWSAVTHPTLSYSAVRFD
mmetsp:Transcript_35316/g.31766  ORF Transcript_35316/g.31766 Transcript_35316/m.31766 type:complete len:150 (-) Transcript_35316:196-645(-)